MSALRLTLGSTGAALLLMHGTAVAQTAPAATGVVPARAGEPAVEAPVAQGAAAAPADSATTPTSAAPGAAAQPAGAATSPPEGSGQLGALPEDSGLGGGDGAAELMTSDDLPKLELYGFADFSYFHVLAGERNVLRQYVSAYPSFYVGHLNLYLSSQLGDRWRSLAEVRFVYTPTGDDDTSAPDGTFPAPDNTANDYAELQRTFAWGGIEVQRVWIEYQPFDFMTIRAGQWFTPYGYWNDDHGSPTIIAVHKPVSVSDGAFPEKQTGLVAYGKYFFDSLAVGYALTLSNGRGPFDAVRDLDNNKAVGGRLYLESSALGTFTLGISGYRGRYTASTKKYRIDASGGSPVVQIYREKTSAFEEISYGADARFIYKNLHLQAEVAANETAYDDPARPRLQGFYPEPAVAADYRRIGGYLLAGYRTPWLNLMPYAMIEHSSFTNFDFMPPMSIATVGVNLRATPNVVLKTEFSYAFFDGVGSTGAGKDPLPYIGSQAAWAF
jgi:hypothetical protein